MGTRLNYVQAAPGAYHAMLKLGEYVHQSSGLEQSLLSLIETRSSQINGCAFCLDMHTKDARAEGESEQRLYLLPAWREASCYSERERAALEWTEAVTLVATDHVPDEVYERVHPHFTDEELANLTLAIGTINTWNRLSVAFRVPAGNYRPKKAVAHS